MSSNIGKERMREIVSVFINHGIGKGLFSINIPVSLRESFEELGPTFVKIGQMLSMRSDLLPDAYINEFQKLQNNAKPENFEEIRNVIENGLKRPISDIFLKFHENPIASASIAQVYLAYLKDGTKVVVKVQRPKVKDTMMGDIAILKQLTKYIKRTPQNKIVNFEEIVEELENSAKNEMNFINEANNIKKFYINNKNVKFITCPVVYDDYTTNDILVLGFIDGIKISESKELLNKGYDVNDLGLKLANNYFKQIFEDGFFHADPHPGNIIIKDNKIAYIDFGMVGTLSKSLLHKFNKFLYGIAFGEVNEMSKAVLSICNKKTDLNIKVFNKDIEEIYNKYVETSLNDVDLNQLITDVFNACRKNRLAVPREIAMLLKGVITIEGVLKELSPDIKIGDMVIPFVKRQMVKNFDIKQEINDHIMDLYFMLSPKIIKEIINLINNASNGKFKIQMEHLNLENSASQLNKMVNRIVFSIIIAAIIVGSSMIVSAEIGPKFYGISSIALFGYIGALIMGFWLLIMIIKSGM